ncbi:acetyl-CoA synthetase-like protein [Trametopsis cervina]|nr:acetyl-CoA synthetase-like protein [Trametopsis cervina]
MLMSTTRPALNLPPIAESQISGHGTFATPPLDGSLCVSDMQDWHYIHSPEHPVFIYANDDGHITTIKWAEVTRAIHRTGHIVRNIVQQYNQEGRPVIAVLAASNTISYYTLYSAIIRADCVCFLISPRNSPAAIAHLINEVSPFYLFVGSELATQNLASTALDVLKAAGTSVPLSSTVPSMSTMYSQDSSESFEWLPPVKARWDDACVILHSSGSTAFPKTRMSTLKRSLLLVLTPYFGERNLTGKRIACHALPMYHGLGVVAMNWTVTVGCILTVYPPQEPAIVPTPRSLMQGLVATESDYVISVPIMIEAWAANPADVENLKSLEGVLYGGGPLSETAGDDLARQGVALFNLYGSTETGLNTVVLPKDPLGVHDWQHCNFSSLFTLHWIPQGNGSFELVFMHDNCLNPCVANTKIDGRDAYATNDLVVPHPTKRGLWRVKGRADDQIVHNNGEKTNPGPIEALLNRDPRVYAALMFGRGRFNTGVLIAPSPGYEFDPVDKEKLAEFRNAIWPTVEKANDIAPQHSRIFKEMIMVASPDKPFTYTAKSTPRRHAIINEYEEEINSLYVEVEETTTAGEGFPTSWDLPSVTAFIRTIIQKVVAPQIKDSEDFFLVGCDSLQVTWIRNSILHALRQAEVKTRGIAHNFVYQHPTIEDLSAFVAGQANNVSTEASAPSDAQRSISEMNRMVDKYSTDFPTHTPQQGIKASDRDVVVLTGTTGALGATLLVELVNSPEIGHVYALNRKGVKSLIDRHWQVMKDRGLDTDTLQSPKVTLLEAATDQEYLGLPSETWEQIRRSVTHIIHNAWPVNFNMALPSFEPNVGSTRRLIDLALASPHQTPARFLFVSSVGVLRMAWNQTAVSPSIAEGSGYAESKWISETLLAAASEITSLRSVSVRVGQISGGASGAWSRLEWFPSLIKSSVKLNALPLVDGNIALLPSDAAAKSVIDMRNSDVQFLHLTHPHPVPWTTIMKPISQELGIPMVPLQDWISSLKQSGEGLDASSAVATLDDNPALKLLDFFVPKGEKKSNDSQAFYIKMMDVTKAQTISRTLAELPPLSDGEVLKWLSYWRSIGFL